MNVGELIGELSALDRELPVAMLSRLGDFCIVDEPLCRQAGLVTEVRFEPTAMFRKADSQPGPLSA